MEYFLQHAFACLLHIYFQNLWEELPYFFLFIFNPTWTCWHRIFRFGFKLFYQDRINVIGNSSLLIILKLLVGFGLFGLASLNLLAKEASIFVSAQFIYGAIVFILFHYSYLDQN